MYITGVGQLIRQLQYLQTAAAPEAAAAAVESGLRELRAGMEQAAPVGRTGNTGRSVGHRFERSRRGTISGKAGIGVGRSARRVPHAHLTVLGTTERFNRRGQSRGRMPQNDWIYRGSEKRKAAAATAAVSAAAETFSRLNTEH